MSKDKGAKKGKESKGTTDKSKKSTPPQGVTEGGDGRKETGRTYSKARRS